MELEQIQHKLSDFNEILVTLGMLPLALVNPKDILPQEKNAHYFVPEKFKLLVNNVKKYGRLASVPLVYKDGEKYRVIDGAHRVESSKEAGLPYILVFVDNPASKDEIISKQLSFNALVGKDDPVILAELFNSIEDMTLKIESGLDSEQLKIEYTSINFMISASKELTFLFIPTDLDKFEDIYEEIAKRTLLDESSNVVLCDINYFEEFAKVLRRIKKVENIKSNGSAIIRIMELAKGQLYDSPNDNPDPIEPGEDPIIDFVRDVKNKGKNSKYEVK